MYFIVFLQKITNAACHTVYCTVCKSYVPSPFSLAGCKKTCTGFKELLKVLGNITSDIQMMYNKNLHSFTCKTSHAILNILCYTFS